MKATSLSKAASSGALQKARYEQMEHKRNTTKIALGNTTMTFATPWDIIPKRFYPLNLIGWKIS